MSKKIEPLKYRPAVEYSSLQEVITEFDTRIRILNEKISEIIEFLNSMKDKKGGI